MKTLEMVLVQKSPVHESSAVEVEPLNTAHPRKHSQFDILFCVEVGSSSPYHRALLHSAPGSNAMSL